MTSLRIRRRLTRLGIPLLDVNARTTSEKVRAQREKIVDELIGEAQVDVLRALAAGTLSIELVEAHKRERGLAGASLLAHVKLRVPLFDALETTLPLMASGRTRKRYETSRDQLKGKLSANLLVRDLPTVAWGEMAAQWPNSASDWMHVRRMLSRFLSVYLNGKHHPFRHEVLALVPHKAEPERTSELTPAQFLALVEKAREDLKPALWTLVLTGMRMGEYLRCTEADLRPAIHAIAVPGSKTAGSKALVRVAPAVLASHRGGDPCPAAVQVVPPGVQGGAQEGQAAEFDPTPRPAALPRAVGDRRRCRRSPGAGQPPPHAGGHDPPLHQAKRPGGCRHGPRQISHQQADHEKEGCAMKRAMTGVGIEPTTYGLKEREATTTGDNLSSDSGALRRGEQTSEHGETHPKKGAVCDEVCMADARPTDDDLTIDWLPGSVSNAGAIG